MHLYWIIPGAALYLIIGALVARLCMAVWQGAKRNWLALLLFPRAYHINAMGDRPFQVLEYAVCWTSPGYPDYEQRAREYMVIIAFIWPARLAFGLAGALFLAVFCYLPALVISPFMPERQPNHNQ